MAISEIEIKKKKGILRAYEKALDVMEGKLNSEEARIEKLQAQKGTKKQSTCLTIFIVFAILFVIMTGASMIGFLNKAGRTGTFYVKSTTVNIRQCPASNCEIIDTFPLNSEIVTQYQSLKEAPDWIEMNYTNDKGVNITGYVVKTVLSEKKISE